MPRLRNDSQPSGACAKKPTAKACKQTKKPTRADGVDSARDSASDSAYVHGRTMEPMVPRSREQFVPLDGIMKHIFVYVAWLCYLCFCP